nr:hypothetical protein [Sinorhizobium medicae]
MITRDLPANASLESIRKQAKALLKAFKAGDGATFQRVKPYFADPHAIGLQEVQLVLAREFGFSGWTKLRAHLTGTRGGEHSAERLAKRFLSLATLSYFGEVPADPERFGEALELLHAHPEIADESIHVAAALGDAAAVGRWLDSEPQLIGYKRRALRLGAIALCSLCPNTRQIVVRSSAPSDRARRRSERFLAR